VAKEEVSMNSARLAAERCLRAMDAARHHLRDLRFRVDMAKRTIGQLSRSDREEESHIVNLVVAIHDELLDSDIGHEAWLLTERSIVEDIAECVDGLVRLHTESFELDIVGIQQRLTGIQSRFDKACD
jgi:hypothetical protein